MRLSSVLRRWSRSTVPCAGKTEAIKAVEAYGAILAAGQQVAGHRAPYIGSLFQEGPATSAQLEGMKKISQQSDVAFARAQAAVGALLIPLGELAVIQRRGPSNAQ